MVRVASSLVVLHVMLNSILPSLGQDIDRLTKMKDRLLSAELRVPSEADKETIRKSFENLELAAVDMGRFEVECICEHSLKTSEGFFLTHFAFIHAEDGKSSERTIFTLQPLITEDSRFATGTGDPMTIVRGRDIDLLRRGKEYFSFNPFRGDTIEKTEFAKEQLRTSEVFDPFMASLSAAATILNSDAQTVDFSKFDPKLANGIAEIDDFSIYSFRYDGVVQTGRRVIFSDGVPVLVEGKAFVEGKPVAIGQTKTTWKRVGEKRLPVRIEAMRPSNLGPEREFRASLRWKLGKDVAEELFDEKSVGKLGFAAH